MEKQRLIYLLEQYANDAATPAELQELQQFMDLEENKDQFTDLLAGFLSEHKDPSFDSAPYAGLSRRVLGIDKTNPPSPPAQPASGVVRKFRPAWLRYAAAVVLIAGAAYLWNALKVGTKPTPTAREESVEKDIAPGGNKAVLTLADGSTILLDSASNGLLAEQGSSRVIKKDGQLIYDASLTGSAAPAAIVNTMSTPPGGQYQLTLPDGTRVWLNVASSITYPAFFLDKQRTVTITGEAYFEVAHDRSRPFHVRIGDKVDVEVLGTHFNVKAYADEAAVRTTLLEGAVRVRRMGAGGKTVVLKPLQQASVSETIDVTSDVNAEQVMAWKNGLFSFKKADLRTVMRELARWYDLEVVYEGPVPDRVYSGEIGRALTLRQVLDGLSQSRVNYIIENNRRIRIFPDRR